MLKSCAVARKTIPRNIDKNAKTCYSVRMIESVPRPITPNYARRRAGAAVLAVVAATGVGYGAEKAVDGIRGREATPIENLKPDQTVSYVAKPGDTAYSIADAVTDGDPRPLADQLSRQAGDDGLLIGEKLKIAKADIDNPQALKNKP